MIKIANKRMFLLGLLSFVLLMLVPSCKGQEDKKPAKLPIEKPSKPIVAETSQNYQPFRYGKKTMFPQIHSNLNGLVSQFVRTMYQDSKGVFWFGTNGDGLIRYDGKRLEEFTKKDGIGTAIRKIAEDSIGRVWFGSV